MNKKNTAREQKKTYGEYIVHEGFSSISRCLQSHRIFIAIKYRIYKKVKRFFMNKLI